jgi:hypothetical protein
MEEPGQLHTLASASSDPLTQYSFDKNKAGQREINPITFQVWIHDLKSISL